MEFKESYSLPYTTTTVTTVLCLTPTLQLVRERVGYSKPSYTMRTDCPAKRKIRKVL